MGSGCHIVLVCTGQSRYLHSQVSEEESRAEESAKSQVSSDDDELLLRGITHR